jgi:hypothetical protein
MFRPSDAPEAARLLVEQCAETLPLLGEPATPAGLERTRFAALKLGGGELQRLREAVRLAQADWRDLLVAAGFADDIHAHEKWLPSRFIEREP